MTVFETYSGTLDLEDPRPDDIQPLDIAVGLSRTIRWGAQSRRGAMTVAQHCHRVTAHVPDDLKLAALLHDAAEAYICDLPTPVKALIGQGYKRLTTKIDKAIGARFGIDPELFHHPTVKAADNFEAAREAGALLGSRGVANNLTDGTPVRLRLWSQEEAQERYLDLLDQLTV